MDCNWCQRCKKKNITTSLTWQHGEYGGEGVEFQAVDDVAEVTHLYGHEDASGGQQEDVQALRNNAQPQHSYGERWLWQRNSNEEGKKKKTLSSCCGGGGDHARVNDGVGVVIGIGGERDGGMGHWGRIWISKGEGRGKDGGMGGDRVGKGGLLTPSPISLTFTVRGRIHDPPGDDQHPGLRSVCVVELNIRGFEILEM